MVVAIGASLVLVAAGIAVSVFALRKDSVKQGLYGHLAFYLYLFGAGALIIGFVAGLSSLLWRVLVFAIFGWLFIGRVFTFLRLFKELTYLHLLGGIVTVVWIVVNLIFS